MRYVLAKVEMIAKNIVNLDELTTFLADLSTQALNDKVKTWINSNLRKYLINNGESKVVKRTNKNSPEWMIKAIENGEVLDLLIIDKKLKDQWSHVVDYLNTETTDVSRISIPQALDKVKAWDEAMIKNSKKAKNIKEDGITIYFEVGDYTWVDITGKESLKREGDLMGHCVGGYYPYVESGKCKIYSLRDQNNVPHVTVQYEIKNNSISQIRGKGNSVPEKYVSEIRDFLNELEPKDINKCSLKLYSFDKFYTLDDISKLDSIDLNKSVLNLVEDKLSPKKLINGHLIVINNKYYPKYASSKELYVTGTELPKFKYECKKLSLEKEVILPKKFKTSATLLLGSENNIKNCDSCIAPIVDASLTRIEAQPENVECDKFIISRSVATAKKREVKRQEFEEEFKPRLIKTPAFKKILKLSDKLEISRYFKSIIKEAKFSGYLYAVTPTLYKISKLSKLEGEAKNKELREFFRYLARYNTTIYRIITCLEKKGNLNTVISERFSSGNDVKYLNKLYKDFPAKARR